MHHHRARATERRFIIYFTAHRRRAISGILQPLESVCTIIQAGIDQSVRNSGFSQGDYFKLFVAGTLAVQGKKRPHNDHALENRDCLILNTVITVIIAETELHRVACCVLSGD